MVIAILGDSLDLQTAGIHSYTRELINLLTTRLGQYNYVVIRPEPGKEANESYEEVVVPVHSMIPGHQRMRQFFEIPELIRKIKPDIVIEPAHFGPFFLPPEIRRITIIHDLTPLLFPAFHSFSSTIFHRLLMPHVVRHTDHLVAVSQNTLTDLHRMYPVSTQKSSFIYPSISDNFKPGTSTKSFSAYGISNPYFLFVGTLEPRKNVSLLVRTFEIFKEEFPNDPTQLVLAGKLGWKSKKLKQVILNASCIKDIILPGYIEFSDLPALYHQARAFIYPSRYEGFGLPVAEALASGGRVLTTANGSLREFRNLNRVTIFEDDQPKKLATLLSQTPVNSNHRQQIGYLPAFLNPQTLAFQWEKLFESLTYPDRGNPVTE